MSALRDLGALVLACGALAGSFVLLERARSKSEPRRTIARVIRREASPKDLVIVTDEAPELVSLVRPIPALWGVPPIEDLDGVRRVYALAPNDPALTPFFVRLGPAAPFHGERRARRWDITDAHLSRKIWNAVDSLGVSVQARRDGGADNGPCTAEPGRLACAGAPWNHVVAEPHHFDGVELRCVYAHPQADSSLVIELTAVPPARALVGVIGIDDAGFHPDGAPVTMRVEYRAESLPAVVRTLVAPNRRGLTPYRIDVGAKPATATLTITTPNAGARQFCFTMLATS